MEPGWCKRSGVMCGSCLVRGEEVVGLRGGKSGGYGFICLMDDVDYSFEIR